MPDIPKAKLYISKDKYGAHNLVAEAAQMARDPVLHDRAMAMFKNLEEDAQFEEDRSWEADPRGSGSSGMCEDGIFSDL